MNLTELDKLIDLYGKYIYSFCLNLTGQKMGADDLYQETFLKAVEQLEHIDRERNPKSYLIALATGIYRNNRKKFAIRYRIAPMEPLSDQVPETLVSTELSPEEKLISDELKEEVKKAASKLPEKLKIALYMYYTAQMSVEEIATALKIPKGTVKSRLHKARCAMKKILEDSHYEIY